jgi:hypothetical protein
MRAAVAAKEAEARRAHGPQILAENAGCDPNARQDTHAYADLADDWRSCRRAALVPVDALFNLWAIQSVDLRMLDRHREVGVTSLIPWLSCRSSQPKTSFVEPMRQEDKRQALRDGEPLESIEQRFFAGYGEIHDRILTVPDQKNGLVCCVIDYLD